MDPDEIQKEEAEVLGSIYEGDENFKVISDTCYQYKFTEEGKTDRRSFIIEVSWPKKYPEEIPDINLDVFFNKNISPSVKESIKSRLVDQAGCFLGEPMTYTLFNWILENRDEFISQITDCKLVESEKRGDEVISQVKKEKKEQLSKAQKRKLADQLNSKGERERGWNWVDVVKHLSQTGSQTQVS